mmetsp:Transcript_7470/g.22055  ORF Transcript_7470/g.22055 Transcript_7470/m.22055 type:complete len:253 (-) Transcript_7470:465-1223(-)
MPRKVPLDAGLSPVLLWREACARPHDLHRRQPRGVLPPLGALLRRLGRAQHLLPRVRGRGVGGRRPHRRAERHLQRAPLPHRPLRGASLLRLGHAVRVPRQRDRGAPAAPAPPADGRLPLARLARPHRHDGRHKRAAPQKVLSARRGEGRLPRLSRRRAAAQAPQARLLVRGAPARQVRGGGAARRRSERHSLPLPRQVPPAARLHAADHRRWRRLAPRAALRRRVDRGPPLDGAPLLEPARPRASRPAGGR